MLSESLSSNTSGSAPDTAITDNHETDPREKERDLTQSYDNLNWQHKNATKNFDYTTISDRLRTVSWSKDSYQLVWLKPVNGIPTFPPKRIKTKHNFSAAVSIKYHDLPVSALVLISVAIFNIYTSSVSDWRRPSAISRYELKMADSERNNRPEWPIKIPDSGLNGL